MYYLCSYTYMWYLFLVILEICIRRDHSVWHSQVRSAQYTHQLCFQFDADAANEALGVLPFFHLALCDRSTVDAG